jgi:hypothetical protein
VKFIGPVVGRLPTFVITMVYSPGTAPITCSDGPVRVGVKSGAGIVVVVVVAIVVGVVGAAPPVGVVVVVATVVDVVAAAVVVVPAVVVGAGAAVVGGTVLGGGHSWASALRASLTASAAPSASIRIAATPLRSPHRRTLTTSAAPIASARSASSTRTRGLLPVAGSTQSVIG